MKKILTLLLFILFLSSCSVFVYHVADIRDINPVTGPYSIGTKRFQLIDSLRTNWYLDGYENTYRNLMIQIWYPAEIQKHNKKSAYIDNKSALTYTIKNQGYNVPKILTNQISNIKCNSWDSAKPVSNEKFPLIIFSHGHGGLRTQNTNQVEELVSHGYIVIAVDHTYDAGFVEFLDGSTFFSLTARSNDDPIIETPEQFYTRFGYRVDDIDFIINIAKNFSKYDNDIFNLIDIDNIGIFGHSFGGLTSFYSGLYNNSIKSCYALDGWFEPLPDTLLNIDINKPLFHIGQHNKGEIRYWKDINHKKLISFMESNSNLSIMIDIPGSSHYDYTDFTYFTYLTKKMNFSGYVPHDSMAKIMNVTLLDFFNYTLKNIEKINPINYKKNYPFIDIIMNK